MEVGKVFHKVGSQVVPVVRREERYVVDVNALRCLEEYAEHSLLVCLV